MSGHVSDRWHLKRKPKRGEPTCEHRKIPTAKHGNGRRWQAEYAAGGRMHYPCFDTEEQANHHLVKVLADELRGTYRDESSAKMTVREYATTVFLPAQATDPATRSRVEGVFRTHILPALGDKRLRELESHPSLIQGWVSGLPLAPLSAARAFGSLNTMMRWAARDKLIGVNPCSQEIKLPRVTRRRIEPWAPETIARVRGKLPARWQAITDAGTGLGARQGELFALAVENIDFLRRVVHIRVQVKLLGSRLVYSAPKSKAERSVPLARQTGDALAAHLHLHPAVAVELPWHEPGTKRHGRPHTLRLLFTSDDGRPLNRNTFNDTWRDAVKAAGLPARRENGCHMMRHVFASTLIARGIDVRTVAEYLGHTDGGALCLRTYSHLLPDAEDRARRALEDALSGRVASHDTDAVSSET